MSNIKGIIYNSVGTLHSSPSYASEIVTQVLLGSVVDIVEVSGDWRKIETSDKYSGWIRGSVATVDETELNNYLDNPKIIVTSLVTCSHESADVSSITVSDLVVGDILSLIGEELDFYEVAYPDGRIGFVKKDCAERLSDWKESIVLTRDNIVSTSFRFLGVPYLWGGTSYKGLDCSGLTKTVYMLNGVNLPRDASQQVEKGVLVDTEGNFDDLLKGDLLFFGTKECDGLPEKVVHVAIYIGDKRFIHASDYVRINSFDPQDSLFDEFNANRYLRAKRYIEDGVVTNEYVMR